MLKIYSDFFPKLSIDIPKEDVVQLEKANIFIEDDILYFFPYNFVKAPSTIKSSVVAEPDGWVNVNKNMILNYTITHNMCRVSGDLFVRISNRFRENVLITEKFQIPITLLKPSHANF